MLTVLIAEKKYIDAIIKQNHIFFEPFFKSKELAICEWHTEGQSFHEAVPDLANSVARVKEWRVIIVFPDTNMRAENPYDVVDVNELISLQVPPEEPADNLDTQQDIMNAWTEYYNQYRELKDVVYKQALEFPLQKLTTALCYKRQDYILNEIEYSQDVEEWAIAELQGSEAKLNNNIALLEKKQFKHEQICKEVLRRDFLKEFLSGEETIGISQPTEVICVAARCSSSDFFDPARSWNVHNVHSYSGFADRNMYFDKMFFTVMDILPVNHASYRIDLIRFLYNILMLAVNPLPESIMQSRKLYLIDSENNDEPLYRLVTSYERKLDKTSRLLEKDIDRILSAIPSDLTDSEVKDLFCAEVNVSVDISKEQNNDSLLVDKNGYGLASDCPENETDRWSSDYSASLAALDRLLKQPRRAVSKAVDTLPINNEVRYELISSLNSFQMDDVREFTQKEEETMESIDSYNLYNPSGYYDQMKKCDNNIRSILKRRMKRKTTIGIGMAVICLFILSFLPLIFNNRSNINTVLTSLAIIFASTVFIAVVLFVVLLFLRRPIKKAIKEYNENVENIRSDIKESVERYSKYLSALCNTKRGYSVLEYSKNCEDKYTRAIRIRKKHQEDIRKKRAELKESYSDFISYAISEDEETIKPYNYDFDRQIEYSYPLEYPLGTAHQIEFLKLGNFAVSPTDFVKKITLTMEEIYDS